MPSKKELKKMRIDCLAELLPLYRENGHKLSTAEMRAVIAKHGAPLHDMFYREGVMTALFDYEREQRPRERLSVEERNTRIESRKHTNRLRETAKKLGVNPDDLAKSATASVVGLLDTWFIGNRPVGDCDKSALLAHAARCGATASAWGDEGAMATKLAGLLKANETVRESDKRRAILDALLDFKPALLVA